MNLPLKNELLRKTIHLSFIWIPIIYSYLDKKLMIIIMFIITSLAIILEILKRYNPILKSLYNKFFKNILREEEKTRIISDGSYLLLACFMTILFFSKFNAILAISVLIVSDPIAALFGKKFGKIIISDNKTLEGFLAFICSGLLVLFTIGFYSSKGIKYYIITFFIILISAIVELFSKKIGINDNFLIPFLIALTLTIFL
ncbi:MAG: diacylglycerol/polyprenol kinase family protein [Alphaproteobacteria bacterium]